MKKTFYACWKWIWSGEIFFLLYLIAGQFKAIVPKILSIDTTLFFMALATLCLAYRWLIRKDRTPMRSVAIFWGLFVLLVVLCGLSLFYTMTPNYGMSKWTDLIVKNGWIVVAGALLINNRESFFRFLAATAGWGLLSAVLTIINYIRVGIPWNIAPFSSNYLITSQWVATAAFVFLGGYLFAQGRKKYWALLPFGICFYVVLLLLARSSLLSFAIVLLLLGGSCIVAPRFTKVKFTQLIIPAAVGVAMVAVFLLQGNLPWLMGRVEITLSDASASPQEVESYLAQLEQNELKNPVIIGWDQRSDIYLNATEEQQFAMDMVEQRETMLFTREEYYQAGLPLPFDEILYIHGVRGVVGSRAQLYNYAFSAIRARPLTGWGLGGYAAVTLNQDAVEYPHNVFFELWAESGPLAMIVFLLLLLYPAYILIYTAAKSKENNGYLLTLLLLYAFWGQRVLYSNLTDGSRSTYAIAAICCVVITWADSNVWRAGDPLTNKLLPHRKSSRREI